MILSGFMVPKPIADEADMQYLQWGYSQFMGTGDINNWHGYREKGFPKIASKRVRVVLREMEEYKKRCETRTERPVHPDHCERCWACLDQLARDNELKTYPSVEAAVAAA